MARRIAIVLVGGCHRGASQSELTRRPAGDEGGLLRIALRELLAGRIVPDAAQIVGGDDATPLGVDLDTEARLRIPRLPGDDEAAVAELREMLAGIAAGVGLLAATRQRALGADRESTRGGRRSAREHAGRKDEDIVGPERITGRIAFLEQDARRERPPAEQAPLFGEGLDADGLGAHVDPHQPIALPRGSRCRVCHRRCPL